MEATSTSHPAVDAWGVANIPQLDRSPSSASVWRCVEGAGIRDGSGEEESTVTVNMGDALTSFSFRPPLAPRLDKGEKAGGEEVGSPDHPWGLTSSGAWGSRRNSSQALADEEGGGEDGVTSPPVDWCSTSTLKLQDLRPLQLLGAGAYGQVYLVEDRRCGARYALKRISKAIAIQTPRALIDEVRSMRAAEGSPFVCSLLRTFADKAGLYLLMEPILGGELFSHILASGQGRVSEESARFYVACAVLALGELHRRKILHRDVKPENLLLDQEGYLRLVDFGSAVKMDPTRDLRTVAFCGTPNYLAPEVLLQHPYQWSFAADCWALGCVLFFMLTGSPPFHCSTRSGFGTNDGRISTGRVPMLDPTLPQISPTLGLSEEARDLIGRLLERSPDKRLGGGSGGAAEIQSHPWFASMDWEKLHARKLPAPCLRHGPGLLEPGVGVVAAKLQSGFCWAEEWGAPAVDLSDSLTCAIVTRLDNFFHSVTLDK